MKKTLQTLFTFVFLIAIAGVVVWLEAGNETVLSGRPLVIDGDSLEIGGERLRLLGIDAPELNQMCERGAEEWKCGRESRRALRRLVGRGSISCRTSGIDKYDRWLVECEVDGRSVNEEMVGQGWAVAYGDYYDAEQKARARGIGLWVGIFESPQQWRDARHGDLAASPVYSSFRTVWMRFKRLVKSVFDL